MKQDQKENVANQDTQAKEAEMVCVVIPVSLVALGLVESKDRQGLEADQVAQVLLGRQELLGLQVTGDCRDVQDLQDLELSFL